MAINKTFWQGRKILITGHTGFKGSWLSLWLQKLGCEVVGYSLPPPTKINMFEKAAVGDGMTSITGDIRHLDTLTDAFESHRPEIVFHLAAQPLVRDSYHDPVTTYETNVLGTLHVLQCIRQCDSVRSAVMISTDKCYENREWDWGYRENDPLGGHDPYSSSKACAEILISSFRASYLDGSNQSHPAIASARAGNVIGGGDWAKDRLIPGILHAMENNKDICLRNPQAVRPWQHVLEPLSGYLMLAEKLIERGHEFADSWNFGPHRESVKPVSWIANYLNHTLGSPSKIDILKQDSLHEASMLALDCAKANNRLNWHPLWDLPEALNKIVEWSSADSNGEDLRQESLDQIEQFMQLQAARG